MATTIQLKPERAIFNAGLFDSDYRYLRETASGYRTTLLAGPSVAIAVDTSLDRVSWRFKCGSFQRTGVSQDVAAPSNVTNTPTRIAL